MPPELEAKLIAPDDLRLPELSGLVDGSTAVRLPERHLEAAYYDTADLRLARSGITVRYRTGEDGPPWTVKFPENSSGAALRRREVMFDGPPDPVQGDVTDLVRACTRSRPLELAACLRTERTPIEIRGRDGQRLAEVTDDRVTVHDGRGHQTGHFREVEVEVHAGRTAGRDLMRAATRRLVTAGCCAEPPVPKLIRALGERASRPPEVVIPRLEPDATVSALIRHATSRSVTQIMRHDPGIRLGEDPEDVHQFPVATRRLRSDLRAFAKLLDPEPVSAARDGLRMLGARAGAARDAGVLSGRLRAKADQLPQQDAAGAGQLLRRLDSQARTARAALLEVLRTPAYDQLLDALVSIARQPPIAAEPPGLADRPAADLVRGLMRRPWRRLKRAAEAFGSDSPDTEWHAVRIRAKRCRYTAEAIAPLCGHQAKRFAAAIAEVQALPGDHQDTVVAEALLRDAAAAVPAACIAAGQLIAGERLECGNLRSRWPAV